MGNVRNMEQDSLVKIRCVAHSFSRHWEAWPGYLLFFMMLFVPTTYPLMKAILLAFVLGVIFVGMLERGQLELHPTILLWTLFMVIVGGVFMVLGMINGTPGAWRVGTIYILWPLVYTVLVAGIVRKDVFDGLFRVLVLSTIAIALYTLSYLLHEGGWLPDTFYIEINQGQSVGFYSGYIEYAMYSLSSLLFLVPFLVTALLIWTKDASMPVSRFWLWVAFFWGLILTFLSGRRALLLVVAMAPVLTLILWMFLAPMHKSASRNMVRHVFLYLGGVGVVLFIGLKFVIDYDLQAMAEMFLEGFDFGGDESPLARAEQFLVLLQEWAESPLLGQGHGAAAFGSLRSDEQPWAYELSYMALLFHTGLIGFLAYASGVVWIFWMGLKIIRSGSRTSLYMTPVLVGTACFLVGNATNPYLEKFDYLWVIFLPVALINYWLLHDTREY